MGFIALSPWVQAHDDSAVALKLLIGYVQAAASLTVITAGGEQLFLTAFGWTAYASMSPFSMGALQCQLQWGVLARYVALVCLPALAVASAVVAAVMAKGMSAVRFYCGFPVALDVAAWAAGMREWRDKGRLMATCMVVAFVSYMPIMTASLYSLVCTSVKVNGVRWLYSDLSVQCYTGEHAITMALAVLVLTLMGIGMPLMVFQLLGRVRPATLHDPVFATAYSFMYYGYRSKAVAPKGALMSREAAEPASTEAEVVPALPPPSLLSLLSLSELLHWLRSMRTSLLWWEVLVVLRKASLVVLATAVTNKFYQVVGAVLLLAIGVALQQIYKPFTQRLFNAMELLVMIDLSPRRFPPSCCLSLWRPPTWCTRRRYGRQA